jgi:hypothetical protein
MDKEVLNPNDNNNIIIIKRRRRTSSLISLRSESIDDDVDECIEDVDECIEDVDECIEDVDECVSLTTSENTLENTIEHKIEHTSECRELFIDNLERVNKCNCSEIVIVDDDYTDYEIINESICIPIKNRYRKQTWYEYFRKLYMVSVILMISIIVYFYYSYGNRKDNVVNKM